MTTSRIKQNFEALLIMGDRWKSESERQSKIEQLKQILDEYEGIGEMAERVENFCFQSSKTETEYLKKLEEALLRRSLDNDVRNCAICSFLRKVSDKDWKMLNQLEI